MKIATWNVNSAIRTIMNWNDYFHEDVLKDGSLVVVRAIKPDDKDALQDALKRLSSDSAYTRFFYPKRKFSTRELKFFTELDFDRHVALGVGLVEGGDTLPIGIGRYIVEEPDSTRAEVAFTVADEFQGLGVGSMLLKHLAGIARELGIAEFFATTLATNQKMLRVFSQTQLPMKRQASDGVVEIKLALIAPKEVVERPKDQSGF